MIDVKMLQSIIPRLMVFYLQNCQYTASSFPSLRGPDVKFKFLLLQGDFELHVWRWILSRREAAFLFLWRFEYIYRSSWMVSDLRHKHSLLSMWKAGLSVNLCLGPQPPVFPRLARTAGSFSDPSNSPAERT